MGTTAFPGAVDDFATTSPTNLSDDDAKGRTHSERHDDMESAMEAVQTYTLTRAVIPTVIATRTAGDITVTSSAAALDTAIDLVIAAVAGDVLMIGLSALLDQGSAATDYARLSAATMVSGLPVTYLGANTGSISSGIQGWFVPGIATTSAGISGVSGTFAYVVQSGDLSGGNVTLRLYGNTATNNRTLRATTNDPLHWWVSNYG